MNSEVPSPQRGNARATKFELLDAAGRIVRRDGALRLTIDGVAAEAGVSKGGVLYHFSTKDALIAAFVDGVVDAFAADFARKTQEEHSFPHAALRGYVRAATLPDPIPNLTAGMIVALAWKPELGEAVQSRFREWHAEAMEGVADPVQARAVCLAADGVWFSALFGYGLETPKERQVMTKHLLALADLAAIPPKPQA